jgi:hypothetical protein
MDKNNDIFKNIVEFEIQENLSIYRSMCYHISNIKKDKIIRDEMFISVLDRINEIFKRINSEMIKLQDIAQINSEIFRDFSTKQTEFNMELVSLVSDVGFGNIRGILKMMIDNNDYNNIEFNIPEIEFIDKYFLITSCNMNRKASTEISEVCDIVLKFIKTTDPMITQSLVYKINNCSLEVHTLYGVITMKGYFMIEQVNSIMREPYFMKKYNDLVRMTQSDTIVPVSFSTKYIEQIPDAEFAMNSVKQLTDLIESDYSYSQKLHNMLINDLSKFFEGKRDIDRRKILVLLLLLDETDHISANILFGNCLTSLDCQKIKDTLHWSVQKWLQESDKLMHTEIVKMTSNKQNTLSYHEQLITSKASDSAKSKAMMKIKEMNGSKDTSAKAESYLMTFFNIPFGVYREEAIFTKTQELRKKIDILVQGACSSFNSNVKKELLKYKDLISINNNDMESYINSILKIIGSGSDEYNEKFNRLSSDVILNDINKRKYMKFIDETLNKSVYGHENVKKQFKMLFCQWFNGGISGTVLGLQGCPGIGKTQLVKNGLSKCIIDGAGNPRPFFLIALAGAKDSSLYEGHSYTYTGSQHGKFLDALIESKCMNPIIFFDEVDKVSETAHGSDITKLLIHLTDPVQNDKITDKFFQGVDLDFSKCIFIFSYNNASKIDPILRNRITQISMKTLQLHEKIEIVKLFSIPDICKTIGLNHKTILIEDETIEHLITTYTNEAGMRKLNEKLVEILRHINYDCVMDNTPIKREYIDITINDIDRILEDHIRARHKKIIDEPAIGVVNGLYACESGTGGITLIQVKKSLGSGKVVFDLTGKQGDVMKESMHVAKTLALEIVSQEEGNTFDIDKTNLHVHCPDGATPKDGPSAGAAITLALYSIMTGKKINNTVAMTGEIDLFGNVGAIGGLEAKINGAIHAGCQTALIPVENEPEYNKLHQMLKDKIDIIMVSTFSQVLRYSIIQ